jgi:hypothetical protein
MAESDGDTFPATKAELMARIEREWAVLQALLAQVSEEQMEAPGADGWSVKDQVAHLAAWERHLLLHHATCV